MNFTGHERDGEIGLDYMFARYYGTNLYRFLSRDTGTAKFRRPLSWNRYSYVENNPMRFNDPNGEDLQDVVEFAGGFVRGAVASITHGAWPGTEPSSSDSKASLLGQLTGSVYIAIEGTQGTAVGGSITAATAPACVTGAGCGPAIGGAALTTVSASSAVGAVANMAKVSDATGAGADDEDGERDGSQDQRLSRGEIDALEDAGIDVHELKGGKGTGKLDLFKDKGGDIYVKPKSGDGPGESTGLNIKNFKKK